MKSKHKVERFDYSKYKSDPYEESEENLKEYQFWGLHPKSGRIHVDTKRFIKECELFGAAAYANEGMVKNRNTPYFIPAKKNRHDYAVNVFVDLLFLLEKDWNEEYKPLFDAIKTPEQVKDETRLNMMQYTSCADDLDDIDTEAFMAGMRRSFDYSRIYQSIYCQFIQKLCTEVERYILIFMKKLGFKGDDFSYPSFYSFSDALVKDKHNKNEIRIDKLNCFKDFDLLRKINNFLKHNSITSYLKLKKYYPDHVASTDNRGPKAIYKNGMFAGDWIIIDKDYIEKTIKNLQSFFIDYCETYLNENVEEACWNYDEYFIDAYENMVNDILCSAVGW